jgi:hypothetical protein
LSTWPALFPLRGTLFRAAGRKPGGPLDRCVAVLEPFGKRGANRISQRAALGCCDGLELGPEIRGDPNYKRLYFVHHRPLFVRYQLAAT